MKNKLAAAVILSACLAVPASTQQDQDYTSIRFEFKPGAIYAVHPKVPEAICVISEQADGSVVGQCAVIPARLSLGDPV